MESSKPQRLLEVERLSHDCMLAEDTFQAINGLVEVARQRVSGLRFADVRVHALWHAVILFRQLAEGFRAAGLHRHLAALRGRNPEAISQGAITYQLRRLRLHGLIERLPHSFRYRVDFLRDRKKLLLIYPIGFCYFRCATEVRQLLRGTENGTQPVCRWKGGTSQLLPNGYGS
jgi:hypothetical protein